MGAVIGDDEEEAEDADRGYFRGRPGPLLIGTIVSGICGSEDSTADLSPPLSIPTISCG